MKDLWDDLINKHSPTKENILKLVDDYTLFCHYIGEDVIINQVFLSPLREIDIDNPDTLPSFSIYEGHTGELRFYDFGKGGKGGNIFDFVGLLYGLTYKEVLYKINSDFELGYLGGNSQNQIKKPFLKPKQFLIKPRDPIVDIIAQPFTEEGLNFWKAYYITEAILKEYNVNQVKAIKTSSTIIPVKSLAFSYRIGVKFKIYQPYDIEYKFRNNYPSSYVEGYYQLIQRIKENKHKKILFITKSTKDVMVFRALNLDAIAPKAENIVIPATTINYLKTVYPTIVLLLDADPSGIQGASRYDLPAIWLPLLKYEDVVLKDIADYIKIFGPDYVKKLLHRLLTT